jgi:hypothetical protein
MSQAIGDFPRASSFILLKPHRMFLKCSNPVAILTLKELKIRGPKGRVASTPAFGTTLNLCYYTLASFPVISISVSITL